MTSSMKPNGFVHISVLTNLPLDLKCNRYNKKLYDILEQEVDKAVDDYKIDRAFLKIEYKSRGMP